MKYFFSIFILIACSAANAFSQKSIISTSPTLQDKFAKKSGNLRFSTMSLRMGTIKSNEIKIDTIHILNSGSAQIRLTIGKSPSCIEANVSSTKLPPNTEGWISIKYDASKKNDYGFVVDHFELVTDDSLQPVKSINVLGSIAEYFPPMTSEDSATIQKGRMNETSFNYGKIKPGDKVNHKFMVVNEGKKDLVIHKIKSTCTCLKSSVTKNTIASGDTTYISVDFDSKNKEGKDSRKLNVYLNDPSKPEVVLEMKGEIIK